uniref:Uncharacterized protein n=1 Tax=Timema genevievae TaxID=629358 RepID=A0A7R9JWR2_TIMGE|nr:unnamed protein product [Timema genevievae]
MASLVLTDSSQVTADSFEKLPDQIMLRRKKTTVRKYGILASREDMEMTPLGAEEDDDDTTLFDVNNHSRQ